VGANVVTPGSWRELNLRSATEVHCLGSAARAHSGPCNPRRATR
jgi:hypothetical protein